MNFTTSRCIHVGAYTNKYIHKNMPVASISSAFKYAGRHDQIHTYTNIQVCISSNTSKVRVCMLSFHLAREKNMSSWKASITAHTIVRVSHFLRHMDGACINTFLYKHMMIRTLAEKTSAVQISMNIFARLSAYCLIAHTFASCVLRSRTCMTCISHRVTNWHGQAAHLCIDMYEC